MNTELISELRGEDIPEDLKEAYANKAQTTYTGFIAQEVEATANELNYDFSGVKVPEDPETGTYGLRYAEFVVPLVKSTQELYDIINNQQAVIDEQQNELDDYKAALNDLVKRVDALEAKATRNNDRHIFSSRNR